MFAEQRSISGDYSLIHGEDLRNSLYIVKKGQSVSVAGPLHNIGWNQTYVLFTDDNWPTRWNVIDVGTHQMRKITEPQREGDNSLKSINILTPTDAWAAAKRGHS
jgi:hypothetical protein